MSIVTDEMVRLARNAYAEEMNYNPDIVPEKALRAAIEAALRAMWRPIEELPKKGETVQFWHGKSGLRDRVVVGAYDEDAKHPWRFLNNPFPMTAYARGAGGGDGMANSFLSAPTHFAPLLPPPEGV